MKTTLNYNKHTKPYIAEINELDGQYTFKRDFLLGKLTDVSSSGVTGLMEFELTKENQIYEIYESHKTKYFAKLVDNELVKVSKEEVIEALGGQSKLDSLKKEYFEQLKEKQRKEEEERERQNQPVNLLDFFQGLE